MYKKICSLIFLSFMVCSLSCYCQGGDLLIQQYDKGPELDRDYSRWYLRIGPQLNLINTNLRTTSPKISLGGIIELEYRLSKTIGLLGGAQYTPIIYSYPLDNFIGNDRLKFISYPLIRKDQLKYISYPLMLRLQPTDKLSFGLAIVYQVFINGDKHRTSNIFNPINGGIVSNFNPKGAEIVSFEYTVSGTKYYLNYRWDKGNDEVKVTNPYAEGIFKNSFGMIAQVGFHISKRIIICGNFRWVRRSSPSLQLQTNNTSGFQLGIVYRILKTKPRP